jgi:DNA-directed RNA polymerase subunit alpha
MSNEKEYQPLTIPLLSWNKQTITEHFGQLIAQPLEPGFGITLGNSLRRVLLGGVEGAAVTAVIIKGVNNEFAVVPGVVEDTMQLCLNTKQIVVKSKDGKSGKMRLKAKGETTVRVSDIQTDDNLELINGDHVLAHLSEDGELDIEFFVELGRGYSAAQWPEGKVLQEDNKIYLDAMFSPISKVTFEVEKARVGKEIDYDKLVLNIHTNGSENPLDALHYAVSVLRTQLEYFLSSSEIPFNEISKQPEPETVELPKQPNELLLKGIPVELLLKPIDELELSVRAHNCLMQASIKRILDLINLSEDDGLKIKNFGRKSLNEVKDSMKAFGLSFGMDIKEQDLEQAMKERGIAPAKDE